MRQLTIDGRQEDIPERHERMKLFDAPKTMRGQLCMEISAYPHDDAELPRNTTRGRAAMRAVETLGIVGPERAAFLRECGV